MRTLPDNPSLGYLRQEAKDLLASMRESSLAAMLSSAQRALAEQYGFRSWVDLKAEVDRRRVAAETADPVLGAALAEAFGLGAPADALTRVSLDHMGGVWSLPTESGRWSLRPLFDWIDEAQAAEAVRLMDAAAAVGIATPKPLRSAGGRLVESVGGRGWRADEWMQLRPSPSKPVGVRIASAVGTTLAKLHGLSLRPRGSSAPPSARPTDKDWRRLLGHAKSVRAPWAGLLEDAIPFLLELAAIPEEEPQCEPILCLHGLSPANTGIGHDGELVPTHWEYAGAGNARLELAGTIALWTTGNPKSARALFDAYVSEAGPAAPLTVATFGSSVSGSLWWTSNRVARALDPSDTEQQELAARELPALLSPASPAAYEQLVDALTRREAAAR